MNKEENIADLILVQLEKNKKTILKQFLTTKKRINYFILDNLLPEGLANSISNSFPPQSALMKRKNIREHKYVSSQMNQFDPKLESTILAFQDKKIISWFKRSLKIASLYPDKYLYAGGISSMGQGHFLNPHIDNSHDRKRKKWRVLNLLYYVSPKWQTAYGGNLEIWEYGLKRSPTVIGSKFNRLVVMETHSNSWHSVSPVLEKKYRHCISNYFFSDNPNKFDSRFNVTSFRGRPRERVKDVILIIDSKLRMLMRKIFPDGLIKTKHIYKN